MSAQIWKGSHLQAVTEKVKKSLEKALQEVNKVNNAMSTKMTALANARNDLRQWKHAQTYNSKKDLEGLLGGVVDSWGSFRSSVIDACQQHADASATTEAPSQSVATTTFSNLPKNDFEHKTFAESSLSNIRKVYFTLIA